MHIYKCIYNIYNIYKCSSQYILYIYIVANIYIIYIHINAVANSGNMKFIDMNIPDFYFD